MEKREFKSLSSDRTLALSQLKIKPPKGSNESVEDETPIFLLYLNYAVNNICKISGISDGILKEEKVDEALKSCGKLEKLANFLWLFKVDSPSEDFPDWEEKTLMVANRIYALRNYFTHLNESGVAPMVTDRNFFVFMEGRLFDLARVAAAQPGLRTEKLYKCKLLTSHAPGSKTEYEFTRRGLIFLICLALYKDEAEEFCQSLPDMRFSTSSRKKNECNPSKRCKKKPECSIPKAKAFIEMFTNFSIRKGRLVQKLDDDPYFRCFTDLIDYLNKVPAPAYDYLALQAENDMLAEKRKKSREIEENKSDKYITHRRFRNRFLSFAAACCEDFDLLPMLKFKRLDTSETVGRKRYIFGKETGQIVQLDRYYQIDRDSLRFSFEPSEHYGDIHIDSLRSSISASALRELLYIALKLNKPKLVQEKITEYFSAYHRILEKMLNAPDCDFYLVENGFLEDFAKVCHASPEALESDQFDALTAPFFPSNLTRYFIGDEKKMSVTEMREALCGKLRAMYDNAYDFLVRSEKFQAWKQMSRDPEKRTPPPLCTKEEVLNPPRICRMSDAALISWVFRYLNLFLENDRKFRQLPLSKQHRPGERDFEYRLIHTTVGKFALDQTELWYLLEKCRPELSKVVRKLKAGVEKQLATERRELKEHPRYMANGNPVRASATLLMLAVSAAQNYRDFCYAEHKKWEQAKVKDALDSACRKYGVRTGMELDREALLKTILGVELDKWSNAFDYQTHQKFANRSLSDSGHIVSQVPFPNDFAGRIMADYPSKELPGFREDGSFDFNAVFRQWKTDVALRDFYNTCPLVTYIKNHPRQESQWDPEAPGIRKYTGDDVIPDFSAGRLNKVIRAIKESENQDKILLTIAQKYWKNFQQSSKFGKNMNQTDFLDNPSVYSFFESELVIDLFEGKKMVLMPNHINRPVLSQIEKYKKLIVKKMDPAGTQKVFNFYRMVEAWHDIQSEDRRKRLEMIPVIEKFAASEPIPKSVYEDPVTGKNRTAKEIRDGEFIYYQRHFIKLTFEQYNAIADLRNAIYHDGAGLEIEEVRNILNSLKVF